MSTQSLAGALHGVYVVGTSSFVAARFIVFLSMTLPSLLVHYMKQRSTIHLEASYYIIVDNMNTVNYGSLPLTAA